ncbi:hypothetical protein Q5P01_000114 [Channa striata]|uniref:SEA domain-containing protein n=1 Tax=Channa striata TaxID=64152 RepID=A0AA88LN25_CHASR|nr:hypothetical protein Q5P01_000114 [Channa striata]
MGEHCLRSEKNTMEFGIVILSALILAGTSANNTTETTSTTVTTATGQTTTELTTVESTIVDVTAILEETFVPELKNRSSIQFQNLELKVVQMWYVIYKTKYGQLLVQVFVIEFRQPKTRASNTEAVVGVQFNNTAPPADIPQADAVAKTLVDAVSNSNNTFNLTVMPSSIQAAFENTTSTLTTEAPTLNTTSVSTANTTGETSATSSSTITTTAVTVTTLTNISSPQTTTTTGMAITTVNMIFKTKDTFTFDLLDLSSPASIARTLQINMTLVPYYQRAFPSFHYLQVTGYSNGSINNFVKLGFESTSVPNNNEIGNVLIKAAPTITAFVIDTNSIFVNDIQVSSGVNHKISVITASCLVLLSWLLTNQQ